ncbi:glycine betaine ABC transporter substrate-binding protein [Alkalihalobacterium alkalinitrilicum]|uniref:glycine betaine ABC transporter substrate-binding protein n=1 Tax=Alkalihalobacterium alkalinitrilicum TaxID=427920 RepID=UPI0009959001|nr:glycine betaine ABC transporter substrate-binding protein [Alkalihalobacterium alkalinitrilicum]
MKKLLMTGVASLLLVLSACGGNDEGTIKVGTQSYTDPKIMAHVIEALVEDRTDFEVDITKDIAASPQIISAMTQGELDVAATLFSGEVYNNHFDVEFNYDPQVTMQMAQEGFDEHFDFKWYDSIGFENAYAMAVSKDIVDKYNPTTISDLAPYADELRFGTDTSWLERPNDGYRAFQDHYDFSFGDERGMEVRLMYEAIENDRLDIITAHTVDPQILELEMRVLEDDRTFFPPYDASLVVNNSLVEENPELNEVFDLIVGLIDTQTMTELIAKVDIEGQREETVAVEFLKEAGLLE